MNVKKIFDLIFEPVEDEEEEKVIVDKPLESQAFKKQEKKTEIKPLNNAQIVSDKRAEIKKKDVLDRNFQRFDISAEDKKKTKKTELKPITKYESQPAMSPIYGILDENGEAKSEPSPNYAPSAKPRSKKSPLGTVLSPIYGVLGQNDPKEEKEIIAKDEDIKTKVVPQSNVEPLAESFDDIKVIKAEIKEDDLEVKKQMADSIKETSYTEVLKRPSTEEETYISSEDITLFDHLKGDE